MNKPTTISVLAVAVFATLGPGVSTALPSQDMARCTASGIRITIVPGITSDYGQGTFTTHGQTGKLECGGFVQGRQIVGPGTFAEEGVFEGDCSGGTGSSTVSLTLPTSDGAVTLSIPVTFTYKPGWGWKSSDAFMGRLLFEYHPTKGDCLNAPVTEIEAAVQALVKS